MQNFYHFWGEHKFDIYEYNNTKWHDVPGVYVFAISVGVFAWEPIYIGKASSFADRLPQHERWEEARRRGAMHVHALVVPAEHERNRIEATLIRSYQPQLNTLLKKPVAAELPRIAARGVGAPSLARLAGLASPTAPDSEFMRYVNQLSQFGGLNSQAVNNGTGMVSLASLAQLGISQPK